MVSSRYNCNTVEFEFDDGATSAPLSPSGQGTIRYNDTTKTFQVSIDGSPYIDLSGTGGVAAIIGGNSGSVVMNFGSTYYLGSAEASATEDETESIAARDGTLSDLYVKAAFNNLDAATDFTVRINGVSQDVKVAVPAGSTAQVSDLANSVAVDAGDRIALEADLGASGSGSIRGCAWGFLIN